MCFFNASLFVSIFLASEVVIAFPTESPHDVLAKLEGRTKCNADLCLRMMTDRPESATGYCTSLLFSTLGTVTITSWVSSTIIPSPATTTQLVGTRTTTALLNSTFTSDQTVFVKRAQTTAPIAALVPLSCTSSVGAPVTAQVLCFCSHRLSSFNAHY